MNRALVTSAADDLGRATGLLLRGAPADVKEARRILSAVRRVLLGGRPRPEREPEEVEQLAIGLRYQTDSPVTDCPLGTPDVRAVVCVARQIASELEVGKGPVRPVGARYFAPRGSRSRRKRGNVASFVQCRTELCAVGALVRRGLGDTPEAVELARRAPRCTDTDPGARRGGDT